jgi:hypothetical protein
MKPFYRILLNLLSPAKTPHLAWVQVQWAISYAPPRHRNLLHKHVCDASTIV